MATKPLDEVYKMLEEAAASQQVPPELMKQLLRAENFGGKEGTGDIRLDRVSPAGARGLMQLMPKTFEDLKKQGKLHAAADIDKLEDNVAASIALVKERMAKRGDNWAAIAADYNGGPRAGDAVIAGLQPPAEETRNYIKSFQGKSVSTPAAKGTVSMATTPEPAAGAPSSRSSSISYTSKGFDPAEAAADYKHYADVNNGLLDQLMSAVGARAGQFNQITRAVGQHAAGESAAIEAEGNQQIIKNENDRSIVTAFNTGHNADSLIIQERVAIEQLRRAMNTAQTEINTQDSVTILDDPLQWLRNQVELPAKKQAYNQMFIEHEQRMANVERDQAQTAAQQRFDVPSIVAEKRAEIAAKKVSIAAKAAVEAAQAQTQAAGDAIKLLEYRMSINKDDFQARRMIANQLAETFRWGEGETAKNAQEKKYKEEVLDPINMRRKEYGLKEFKLGQFMLLSAAEKSDMMKDAMRPLVERNPGEALSWLIDSGAIYNLAETHPEKHRFLGKQLSQPAVKDEEQKVRQELGPKAAGMSPMTIQSMALDRVVKQQQELLVKTRNHDSLPADHWAAINWEDTAIQKATREHPIAADIREVSSTKGGKPVEFKDLAIAWSAKAVAEPKAIPTLAKNISEYIQKAQLDKWARTGAQLGYPRPTEFVFNQLAGTKKTQAWTPAEVEHWLLTQVTAHNETIEELFSPNRPARLGATE